MTGVVLCGGASRRMGKDKGLIKEEDLTWVERSVLLMESLGIPVVISLREEQQDEYKSIFDNRKSIRWIPDLTELTVQGPLKGILSVHLSIPEEDLFIISVDMPYMQLTLLQKLLVYYQKVIQGEQPDIIEHYIIPRSHFGLEPLCCIYFSFWLKEIVRMKLNDYSLKKLIQSSQGHILSLNPSENDMIMNINSLDQ